MFQGSTYLGGYHDEYEYDDDGYEDIGDYREQDDRQTSINMDDSDEDTEEASETDMGNNDEPMEIKEQIYQEKLANLKKLIQQLKDGTHPEYNRKVKRLEHQYHERVRLNQIFREHMLECVEREYVMEKKAAAKEFEEKKVELKDNLLSDFEDKRKIIENERHSMELNGDSSEVKPAMTRKLRRRPNEPAPVPEKRRKPPTTTLSFILDERDIEADLRAMSRTRHTNTPTNHHSPPHHHQVHQQPMRENRLHSNAATGNHGGSTPMRKHTNSNSCDSPSRDSVTGVGATYGVTSATTRAASPPTEARVEDGKLLYERRWYHRGQSVYVEGRDMPRFPGHIAAIGSDAIWVKKTNVEGQKVRIYTSQLSRGKVTIKRRAS